MQIWRCVLAYEVQWVTWSVQGSLVPLAPLPLTLCEGRIGCAGGVGDYQIAPIAARSTAMGRWRLTPPGYGGTCLPAGRSVRGSDTPPACHSTPRTPQGEGLGLCSLGTCLPVTPSVERLGGLYCALILLPALPKMSFQAPSTLAASSWASWASSSAVTSPSGVWPRISSAT